MISVFNLLLLQHHTTHDGNVISACISKDTFMKAPAYKSGIKKDFPENAKKQKVHR